MMKAEWVDIENKDINKAETSGQKGVRIRFMISPFDVPKKANSEMKGNRLSLCFVYAGGEEELRERESGVDGILFFVGKKSGRLWRILIDFDSVAAGKSELNIEVAMEVASNALKQYESRHSNLKTRSFEAVERVLDHYGGRIASMATA